MMRKRSNKMSYTNIKGLLILTFFVISQAVFAQAKKEKLNEHFNVNKNVEIEVDTRYADVIFETWNKDEVVVEAFVEGKNVTNALDDWDLSVNGNSSKIRIRNTNGYGDATVINIDDLENLEDLNIDLGPIIGGAVSVVEPIMEGIVGPILEGLAGTPFPDEFYDGMGGVKFDHEAYEREGKSYLKRYEKQMEKQFGPDFDKAMKKWEKESQVNWNLDDLGGALNSLKNIPRWPFGKTRNMNFNDNRYRKNKQRYVDELNDKYGTNVTVRETDRWLEKMDDWGDEFESDMEEWGEDFEIKMEGFEEAIDAWGENFGKSIENAFENWGDDFEKSMEDWGENLGDKIEKWAEEHEGDWEKTTTRDENGNSSTHIHMSVDTDNKNTSSRDVKRTIIIKMPKKAALDLNVRYGNVKIASAYNANGNISHGSLTAASINGGNTSIDVSYSPITVGSWNGGALTASHVKECSIAVANSIAITSNSSNVVINKLNGSGIISGSFGQLSIPKISDDFGLLTIILENSDLVLNLPDAAFNFNYSGEHNEFLLPKQLETKSLKNGKTEMVNGYHKSRSTGNVISITAKYSDVVLQ